MITRELANGTTIEITPARDIIRASYDAFLNKENKRINVGNFASVDAAIKNATYWATL